MFNATTQPLKEFSDWIPNIHFNLCITLKWDKMLPAWYGVEKSAANLSYYALWWSRSVKTWPPSSASVSVCDSCCLSCCHWSHAASCKPLISAVFPRLIIPSLCLYTHTHTVHTLSVLSTLKHLSISCHTHTHLGIFFLPFVFTHSWCWHCFLTHANTHTRDGQTE